MTLLSGRPFQTGNKIVMFSHSISILYVCRCRCRANGCEPNMMCLSHICMLDIIVQASPNSCIICSISVSRQHNSNDRMYMQQWMVCVINDYIMHRRQPAWMCRIIFCVSLHPFLSILLLIHYFFVAHIFHATHIYFLFSLFSFLKFCKFIFGSAPHFQDIFLAVPMPVNAYMLWLIKKAFWASSASSICRCNTHTAPIFFYSHSLLHSL